MGKRLRVQQIAQILERNQKVVIKNGEDIIYNGKAINIIATDTAWNYLIHNLNYEPINDIYYIGVEPVEG